MISDPFPSTADLAKARRLRHIRKPGDALNESQANRTKENDGDAELSELIEPDPRGMDEPFPSSSFFMSSHQWLRHENPVHDAAAYEHGDAGPDHKIPASHLARGDDARRWRRHDKKHAETEHPPGRSTSSL